MNGLTITIGAVLASSVVATIGGVTRQLSGLSGKIAEAEKKSKALGKALELAAKKAALEARIAQGETGLDAELARVTRAYDAAAQAARRYGNSVAEWQRAQQQANNDLERFQRRQAARERFSANNKKISEGIGGGVAITTAATSAIGTGMDFDTKMSGLGAVSRASEEDMAKLRDQAKDLGEKTAWSASQAAEGMQFLAMAGFKTSEIMTAMPGMLSLASAGAIDLGRAADISSNILTGFGLEAGEMGKVGDILTTTFTTSNTTLEMLGNTMKYAAPIAKTFGMDIQTAAACAAKLGDAGIQGEMAGTALRGMMVRLAKPTKEVQDALDALGVSVKDKAGNFRSMPDILADLAKAEGRLTEAGKARANATIFGTEALSAASVLMEQAASGSLQSYITSLDKTGVADEVASRQIDNLGGDITIMKSAFEGLQITIAERVMPILRSFFQSVTEIISGVHNWMKEHKALSDIILGAVAVFGGLLTAILPVITIFKTVRAAILMAKIPLLAFNILCTANPIGIIVTALAGLAAGFVLAYQEIEPFRKFVDECWETLKAFGSWIADTFLAVLDKIGAAFAAIGDAVKGVSSKASDFSGKSDEEIFHEAGVPGYANGGIVSKPTLAMVGEGGESEAILPLSRLANMVSGSRQAGGVSVAFSPTINISGGGQGDPYEQVRRGLQEGADNLKRQLETLFADQRRFAYA